MAFENARAYPHAPAPTRSNWLDVALVTTGAASLASALGVAFFFGIQGRFLSALIGAGLLSFSASMVLVGRDVTRRWLDFGAELGFTPATRRPTLDFGTDRPPLYGNAGTHPARLRLVLTREKMPGAAPRGHEWLEIETELLLPPGDLRPLSAEARAAARIHAPHAHVRVSQERLVLRAPFAPEDARALVEGLSHVADALEHRHA